MNTTDFKVGEQVYFGRTFGEKTLGEIVKVNPAKLKVKQLDSRGSYKSYPVGTIWMVPPSMCSKVNGPVIQEASKPARPEAEILRDIKNFYCDLSPESLSCDGELPRSQVQRRAANVRRKLQDCFRELGRTVSEDEAFKEVV